MNVMTVPEENDGQETVEADIGDHMRLRKIDDNEDLQASIWIQDMDGKQFSAADPDELGRLIIITEAAYADIVRRLRSVGLSRI